MSGVSRFLGPVERELYLRTVPAIAGLPAAELTAVAGLAKERFFRKGQMLLERGQPVERFHAVVEGRVRMHGHGLHGELSEKLQGVGMLHLLAGSADGIDALAEEDTVTLSLDAHLLRDLYEDHFPLLLNQIRLLAGLTLERRRAMPPNTLLSPWGACVECPNREIDLVEKLILIRKAPPFKNTSIEALAQLAKNLEEVRIDKGSVLWQRGEPSGSTVLIVRGFIRCTPGGDAHPFMAGAGYPMGNIESQAGADRWYTAVADTDVVALRGEIEAFLDLLEDHSEMALDFVAAMATNLLDIRYRSHAPCFGRRTCLGCGWGPRRELSLCARKARARGLQP